MAQRKVLIEWRGPDKPALIWSGRRSWQQWLAPEVIDQMGVSELAMFRAELIGPTWYIGERVDAMTGEIARRIKIALSEGRILPPRTPSQQRAVEKLSAERARRFLEFRAVRMAERGRVS